MAFTETVCMEGVYYINETTQTVSFAWIRTKGVLIVSEEGATTEYLPWSFRGIGRRGTFYGSKIGVDALARDLNDLVINRGAAVVWKGLRDHFPRLAKAYSVYAPGEEPPQRIGARMGGFFKGMGLLMEGPGEDSLMGAALHGIGSATQDFSKGMQERLGGPSGARTELYQVFAE